MTRAALLARAEHADLSPVLAALEECAAAINRDTDSFVLIADFAVGVAVFLGVLGRSRVTTLLDALERAHDEKDKT